MTLLIDNQVVQRVLTPRATRQALERAYADLAAGEAVCRPRIDIRIPTGDPSRSYQWGTMEGGSTAGYFALRLKSDIVYEAGPEGARTQEKYCVRPGRYCGLVLLTRVDTGELVAIVHDGLLQHLRVGADSAIGAATMSRPESATLAMLGSGGMARTHVEALLDVRPLKRLRIHSPTPAHREAFAAEMRAAHGLEVEVFANPAQACRGADILASCTDSVAPVVRGEWLEPGMHVISIGGRPHDDARARMDRKLRIGTSPAPLGRPELGTADEYLGYVARPGDPSWKGRKTGRRAEAVTGGQAGEVAYADVVAGREPGRRSAQEITYSERGNIQGAQFYAVAAVAYEAARERGLGRDIPTDWFLQDIRD